MDIFVRNEIEENVATEFYSNLLELNSDSKYVIHSLTILAIKHISHAGIITTVLEQYIPTVSCDIKLPLMYLIDSVTKNDKTTTYKKLFATRIVEIFRGVFEKVNEEVREKLYFLRHTWNAVFASNVLYDLDIKIRRLDNNWPVTAKPYIQNAHLNTIETISLETVEEYSESEHCIGKESTALQKQSLHTGTLLSINTLAAACLGAHQFINIVSAAEHLYTSRVPKSSFLKERKYKGRFVTAPQSLHESLSILHHVSCPMNSNFTTVLNCLLAVMSTYYADIKVSSLGSPNWTGTTMDLAKELGSIANIIAPYMDNLIREEFEDLLKCEEKFKENFHMNSETFFCLLEMVQILLQPKKNTHPNDGITPKEKLAVVLEYFACGTLQRHIASVYRISKQHLGRIIDDVCDAICTALRNEIPPLSTDNMNEAAKTFIKWSFRNCIGAIDGKHIAIKCPPKSGSIFYNYKGFFSIVLMAVANGNYQFTYVDIGAYGSEGDASIFQNCSLGRAIRENSLAFPANETSSTPYVFVADDAFPLHRRIMKPYKPTKTTPLDERQQIFNYRLSRSRRCVENAFGIMCSKNYCLSKTMFCGPDRAKRVIKACVHIHNFLIRTRKEMYCPPNYADRETSSGEIVNGNFRKYLPSDSLYHSHFDNALKGRVNNSGKIVRENITNYFNSAEGAVSWQRKSAFLE